MEHVFCNMCLPTIFVRKYKVKKLVTDLGWNAVEGSLLTDDAIRREVPPLTHYFDPMHVFFVQGQFSRHVGLLLKALKKMGWTPDSIAEACTNDSIRHRSSTRKVARAQFARELGDAYFTEDGIWKVSASSQLGAAPLLHFLIRFVVFPTITCPDLKKELQAFLLLGSVLSLWVQIKFTPYGEAVRKHAESAEALRNHAEALARRFQSGINAYITAFEEVYGLEKMRPKHSTCCTSCSSTETTVGCWMLSFSSANIVQRRPKSSICLERPTDRWCPCCTPFGVCRFPKSAKLNPSLSVATDVAWILGTARLSLAKSFGFLCTAKQVWWKKFGWKSKLSGLRSKLSWKSRQSLGVSCLQNHCKKCEPVCSNTTSCCRLTGCWKETL